MLDQELNQLLKTGEVVGGFIFSWDLCVLRTRSLRGPRDWHNWGALGAGVGQQVGKRKEEGENWENCWFLASELEHKLRGSPVNAFSPNTGGVQRQ